MSAQHPHFASAFSAPMARRAPAIEMVRNPDFSFPALPVAHSHLSPPHDMQRPVSVHAQSPTLDAKPINHRRVRSAAPPLPTFTFNANDASGRHDNLTPPHSPKLQEEGSVTPSRHGHKRQTSEFVGGDSRFGVESAISSSPTKAHGFPSSLSSTNMPTRPRHQHKRSGAMSMSNAASLMQSSDQKAHSESGVPARNAESLVTNATWTLDKSSSGAALDTAAPRPSSAPRPRVVISDEVEYIPRPLSTISSETESSVATSRMHSVNNSITSVLSQSSPSPPSRRYDRHLTVDDDDNDYDNMRKKSSLEISKRVEKEGEWLKSRSSQETARPTTDCSDSSHLTFCLPGSTQDQRHTREKKHTISHALGLDRRRSEPAIFTSSEQLSRLSTASLQDAMAKDDKQSEMQGLERRTSVKKLMDWSFFRPSKKTKDEQKEVSAENKSSDRSQIAVEQVEVPGKVPISEPAVAETDLDAVFGGGPPNEESALPNRPIFSRFDFDSPAQSYSRLSDYDSSDSSPMLDLDLAIPSSEVQSATHRPRVGMHSSRIPHNRSLSEGSATRDLRPPPMTTLKNTHLEDVFENEDEEETEAKTSIKGISPKGSSVDEDGGVGIAIVDVALDNVERSSSADWRLSEGLRITTADWETERPVTSYGYSSSRLSTPSIDRRPASIIEEVIAEESSPVENATNEQPRTSSGTKSSDESNTPTLAAAASGTLSIPDGAQSVMTPDTFQTSTFSSPDLMRRQGSFDTSRLGTAASSVSGADNRTMSSYAGDHILLEPRASIGESVPSLTSSRSTMISTLQPNISRIDLAGNEDIPPLPAGKLDPAVAEMRRKKRASIQSLSQLMGATFAPKSRHGEESRPQTAGDALGVKVAPKKKEHRLKKLLFWRSKSKQSLRSPS